MVYAHIARMRRYVMGFELQLPKTSLTSRTRQMRVSFLIDHPLQFFVTTISSQLTTQSSHIAKSEIVQNGLLCSGCCRSASIVLTTTFGQERSYIYHTTKRSFQSHSLSNPTDEKLNPVQAALFGFEAIVQRTNPLMHLVKKAG